MKKLRRQGLEVLARGRAGGRALLGGSRNLVASSMRIVERRSHTLGLPPGSLHEEPETEATPSRIDVIRYDADTLEERIGVSAEMAHEIAGTRSDDVTWIDVVGMEDIKTIRRLGGLFELHPLVQEDLTHTTQRPKLDLYPGRLFVVVKMIRPLPESAENSYLVGEPGHCIEQVSFILGDGFVLSFQEEAGDVFGIIRERLRQKAGTIRGQGADYLLYALLDVIIDHYFVTLERMGDATAFFEEQVFDDPTPEVQKALSSLRRQVAIVRKGIWPLRDVLSAALREDLPEFSARTRVYLRDASDHLIQAIDVLETLREVLSSLSDLYLSAVSHRMNEVMKVLTLVGAVFIPMTFLAGIYGMNFEYMPELGYRYGYFILLGVMALTATTALLFFKRKRWF